MQNNETTTHDSSRTTFSKEESMVYSVCEGGISIEGNDGQRIGVRTDYPIVRIYIGNSGVSYTSDSVGLGNNTPSCRLEVRSDGAVGVGNQV
jgi:hypothetical protein